MVIFHSYVSLPEGIYGDRWASPARIPADLGEIYGFCSWKMALGSHVFQAIGWSILQHFPKKTCWTFCSIFLPQMSIFQRDGSPQCHQTWLGRSLWSSHGGLVRWEKHRSKWEIFHCHVWFPEGILLIKHGYLASWGIPERFLFWTDIEQNGSNIFCLINSPPLVASW